MLDCWHIDADTRPTFSALCQQLEGALEETTSRVDVTRLFENESEVHSSLPGEKC